jgi:membrane protein DedA with SNARE-associated domain
MDKRTEQRTRLTDTQALGLLGAWLVFRQITIRVGLALAPRPWVRVKKTWLIPLLTNASPQLIIAGTGASGRWTMIAATVFTSVLMSTISGVIFYWAGGRFGHKLAEMSKRPGSPWASVWNPKQIARAERWMDRWGIIIVFLARATEQFTLPITLVAGASEMRFRRFILAHTAGAIAFAGLFLWIGGEAKTRWPWLDHWLTHTYSKWALWIGIGLLVLLAVAWLLGRTMDQGEKTAEPEPPEPELAAPTDPAPEPD